MPSTEPGALVCSGCLRRNQVPWFAQEAFDGTRCPGLFRRPSTEPGALVYSGGLRRNQAPWFAQDAFDGTRCPGLLRRPSTEPGALVCSGGLRRNQVPWFDQDAFDLTRHPWFAQEAWEVGDSGLKRGTTKTKRNDSDQGRTGNSEDLTRVEKTPALQALWLPRRRLDEDPGTVIGLLYRTIVLISRGQKW
jgi:hypothetical protein